MEKPTFPQMLAVACELAYKVEREPLRLDGRPFSPRRKRETTREEFAAVLAAGTPWTSASFGTFPPPYYYVAVFPDETGRETRYRLMLNESPDQVRKICADRKMAEELGAGLPKDKPKRRRGGAM